MSGNASASSSRALVREEDTKRVPGVSLNKQVVLEEDEYTEALSHIIRRDFFPQLNKLSATNAYLSALESSDTVGVNHAIRQLSALSRPDGESSRGTDRRRREEEMSASGTPFISRTPFGGGGDWDTPARSVSGWESKREQEESSKRRKIDTSRGLDDFQHVYTSEDNASFTEIIQEENIRRREKFGWAYEQEAKERSKRLAIEQGRRQLLIDSGGYVPDDGVMPKRIEAPKVEHRLALMGPPAVPSKALEAGEASEKVDKGKGRAMDVDEPRDESRTLVASGGKDKDQGGTLIRHETANEDPSSALVLPIPNALPTAPASTVPEEDYVELQLDPTTHLAQALNEAGLPETAIVTLGGDIIPAREVASGSGDGLGRGVDEREKRERIEAEAMAEEKDTRGPGVQTWGYKARNALMFGPDANVDPLNAPRPAASATELRQAPAEIVHANTRMPDEDDDDMAGGGASSSARASSPSRSKIAAAIGGTPYRPASNMPTFNNYPLVPVMPSPSPSELGPQAVSDLMTWGTLLSTPRAIGTSSDPDLTPNAFQIRDPQQRDRIGRRLAGDASRAMKERAKGYGTAPRGLAVLSDAGPSRRSGGGRSMGPPSGGGATPRRRADDLTPAARNLLNRSVAASPQHRQSDGLGLPRSTGMRSRGEAMEKVGGWGGLGKRKAPADRTWTPSPAPPRRDN